MPSAKKGPRGPETPEDTSGTPSQREGFAEERAAFETGPEDLARFNQKVELVRTFDRIESSEGRDQVLDLARRLAGG
jgi:hypothetical protein